MFKERFMSAIVLVILLVVFLLAGKLPLLLALLLLSLIAFVEMTKACKVHEDDKKVNALELVGMLGICIYYIVVFAFGVSTYLMLTMIITISLMMMVYVFTFPRFHANQVMAAIFAFVYAPVMLSFLYLTRTLEHGAFLVWLTFIGSWICDTSAYLVGRKIGKHKLAPVLSPKKSIEGAVGGVAGAALVAVLYAGILVKTGQVGMEAMWMYPVICTICSLFSQVGDLAASGIKRNHALKDYGKLIPGHGGIMDRFDSVIFIAPIIYYAAVLLAKTVS